MIKIKELFNRKPKVSEELTLAAEIDGIKLYQFAGSILENNYVRRYAKFLHVVRAHELLKLTPERLEVCLSGMEASAQKGNLVEVAQWIGLFRQLAEASLVEFEVFEIADAMLLLEGEPLDTFSPYHTAIKKKLWEENAEAKAFFLAYGIERMKHLITFPDSTNFAEYLETTEAQILNLTYSKLVLAE